MRLEITCLFIVLLSSLHINQTRSQPKLHIIPQPQLIEMSRGFFILDEVEVRTNRHGLEALKSGLNKFLEEKYGVKSISSATRYIELGLSSTLKPDEAYHLSIDSSKIVIQGSTPHGVFNGIQTLKQIIALNAVTVQKGMGLPSVVIQDQPRYQWRGFMLDESRHFFGKEKVKQTLDLMALHKLNVFHWHLTDEPGWRIEIKKYPKLTEIGAVGTYTEPYAAAAFYTQEDIREIVAYAGERFIQVIPEIDMPGHASAAILSYPYLGEGGNEKHPNFAYNPGLETTYRFLTDVLKEVTDLFDSPYIHIGGDEVHFGNQYWETDPAVGVLKEKNGLKDSKAVEKYFIRRMFDSLQGINRKMIGWDEIVQAGLDKEKVLVMWWRHDRKDVLDEILDQDYPVVLCPRVPLYFDFVQTKSHQNGRKWDGQFADIHGVYAFPDSLGIDTGKPEIKGIQANFWSERFADDESLDFMIWPRLSAMSEAAWTNWNQKDFAAFLPKLKAMYALYDEYGLNYYNFFSPDDSKEPPVLNDPGWQIKHLKR